MSSGWLTRLADADAGLPDEAGAAQVIAAAGPGGAHVLAALAATRAELAAVPAARLPTAVAGRIAAAFDVVDRERRVTPADREAEQDPASQRAEQGGGGSPSTGSTSTGSTGTGGAPASAATPVPRRQLPSRPTDAHPTDPTHADVRQPDSRPNDAQHANQRQPEPRHPDRGQPDPRHTNQRQPDPRHLDRGQPGPRHADHDTQHPPARPTRHARHADPRPTDPRHTNQHHTDQHPPTRPTRRSRHRRLPRTLLLTTLAAAALVVAAVVGPTSSPPTDVGTAAARVLAEGTRDVGTLADPTELAACLARAGAPATGPLLAGRPVVVGGREGTLLVLGTGERGRVRALVPTPDCTAVLADLTTGG